jgi:uncharacterized membrane protein
MKQKILVLLLSFAGISGIFYGMRMDNNIIFVLGVILFVAAYLLIRRKLKEGMVKREGEKHDE